MTIGENVTRLGANAFENCSELEALELSKGTKIIGQAAFLNTEIKSITLLPTVKIIGAYPRKTGREFTSGIESQPARRPLTDDPVCAFDSDCIIYGYRGTEAERYAKEWNLEFIVLEAESGDVNFDGEFNISDVVTLQDDDIAVKARKDLRIFASFFVCLKKFSLMRRRVILCAPHS